MIDFESSFEAKVREVATPNSDGSSFGPLDMQRNLARLLTEHKRVIALQPTGAGKTKAAALPFVTNLLAPAQMIFMTPMRTLTSAQADVLTASFRAAVVARNLGLTGKLAQEWVQQQTGTAPNDPDFLAPATVATFDQALSSATRISFSSSRRRRTVNAVAILGSYLVADELHLFPRGEALATLLCLLKYRPPELPFLLMTATLTAPVADALAELLHATVFSDPLSASDQEILKVANRKRKVRWQAEPLSAEQIIMAHIAGPGRRILVVANTVRRAIELAKEIEQKLGNRQLLRVLHARFYQEDRSQHEKEVRAAFTKEKEPLGGVCIAVATQVVEVGLDISADLVFTELAPANALVQRWGRSARWGGEAEIVVAPPPDNSSGRVYPYTSDDDPSAVNKTREWLAVNASGAGILMGTGQERALLDHAHREADQRWVDTLGALLPIRANDIGKAIAEGDYGLAGTLIRYVNTRTVLICGEPKVRLEEPFKMEGFSLAPGSLMPLLPKNEQEDNTNKALEDDEGEGVISFTLPTDAPDNKWKLRYPIWEKDVEGSEANGNTVHEWRDVTRARDITTQPLLAINPGFVSYDPFFGLSLSRGDVDVPEQFWAHPVLKNQASQQWRYTGYIHETYEDHIRRMLEVYERHPVLGPRTKRISAIVEEWLGWPAGMLDRLTCAAIVAHDAGKLSPAWQQHIRRYQQAIHQPMQPWLVHTDTLAPSVPKPNWNPPRHALSGSAHSLGIGSALDTETNAAIVLQRGHPQQATGLPLPSNVLFTAIATHHTPNISDLHLEDEEILDEPAIAMLNQLLGRRGLPANASIPSNRNLTAKRKMVDQLTITTPRNSGETFALALVIRMLRLADGWSQDPAKLKEVNAK